MEIIKVLLTSVLSVAALFVLTKIMGNRQMSQLSMFDYINGITIGSIAAELATSLENDFYLPLIAMVVYAAATVFITFIASKSMKARRFFNGKTVILFDCGKFHREDMKKAQVDVSEFMTQLRINGCFDLSQLETAVLEPNGKISFLMKSDSRPVQPSDLGFSPLKEKIFPTVILDGLILEGNLKASGYDRIWLDNQLEKLNLKTDKVVLAEISSGELHAFTSDNRRGKDIFQ